MIVWCEECQETAIPEPPPYVPARCTDCGRWECNVIGFRREHAAMLQGGFERAREAIQRAFDLAFGLTDDEDHIERGYN